MKLHNPHSEKDVVAAQIVGMNGKTITVKTETGQILRLPLNQKHRQDKVFLASLKDIWHAHIWIPVNRQLKKLFHYDWLMDPSSSRTLAD